MINQQVKLIRLCRKCARPGCVYAGRKGDNPQKEPSPEELTICSSFIPGEVTAK